MASSAKRRSKGSKAADGKRKRKYSGSDEDGPAFLSSKYAGPSTSKIYNNRFKHSTTPDQNATKSPCWRDSAMGQHSEKSLQTVKELFRADLISAMKMPDSETLASDEYVVILDSWRTEWERGVQVPVNPDALPEPSFRILRKRNKDAQFKLPKKLIRFTRDSLFDPEIHVMSYANTYAEQICRYDMDKVDSHWLTIVNQDREDYGIPPLEENFFELVVQELEVQAYVNFQEAIKSEEGLGVEYDEDAICDVCRSPDSHENNEMVFCDACNICVHQICYGITKIPDGSWICKTCALGTRPPCVLCPNRGGAMKTIRCGQKWAHVGCAVWIPGVSFLNPTKMEPIIKISKIPASRFALDCSLCNQKVGACIQCSEKGCKVAFHVTCAFNEGLQMRASIKNVDDDELKAFCKKHSKRPESEELNGSKRDSLSSEERANLRQQKILEKQAEFFKYVSIDDITEHFQGDRIDIETIYNYWVLKRKANDNHPLINPNVDAASNIVEEDSPLNNLKALVFQRRDLERARNLCYMVKNREKLNQKWLHAKEEIFIKSVEIISKHGKKLSEDQLNAVINANYGNIDYDKKYAGGYSPNMVSVYTNLVGEDLTKTKINGAVKQPKKNENRNSIKTPNPYAKHYLNGLFMRTQRFLPDANKQNKVKSNVSSLSEADDSHLLSDASNSVTYDMLNISGEISQNGNETQVADITSSELSSNFDIQSPNLNEGETNSNTMESSKLENVIHSLPASESFLDSNNVSVDNNSSNYVATCDPTTTNFIELNSEASISVAISEHPSIENTYPVESLSDINTLSKAKTENDASVFVSNDTDKETNIKMEESELIYMPDLDVGANVKMEEINSSNVNSYDCIYNPYEIDSDTNILVEEYVYNSVVIDSDIQTNIENTSVNYHFENLCDKVDTINVTDFKSTMLDTEFEIDANKSPNTCIDELSSLSTSEANVSELNADSHESIDGNIDNEHMNELNIFTSSATIVSETDLSFKTDSTEKSIKSLEKEFKTNFKSTKQKNTKHKLATHKKLSSQPTLKKVSIKLNKDLEILKETQQTKFKTEKIDTQLSKDVNSEASSVKINCINDVAEEPSLDLLENNLKLEVKKNNNRVKPLPYIVLTTADVAKCMQDGDSTKCNTKNETVARNKSPETKDITETFDDKEQSSIKRTKMNGLSKNSLSTEHNLNRKNKSDKPPCKNSPSRTISPTSMKVSENGVLKTNKVSKRKFNPDSSSVFSKQSVVKIKHNNNLSTSSVSKLTSSSNKCQEKSKSPEKPENSSSNSMSIPFPVHKTVALVSRKDTFRGYKIPKKPQTKKPEENSLDLRRGNTPLSPIPDIASSGISGYQSKTTWRKLEPRSEKVNNSSATPKTGDLQSQENPSDKIALKIRKNSPDSSSPRWKSDQKSFNRRNGCRNWDMRHIPPLMPPPPPFPSLLSGGPWSCEWTNPVNFRPIHNNYSHGPFT